MFFKFQKRIEKIENREDVLQSIKDDIEQEQEDKETNASNDMDSIYLKSRWERSTMTK